MSLVSDNTNHRTTDAMAELDVEERTHSSRRPHAEHSSQLRERIPRVEAPLGGGASTRKRPTAPNHSGRERRTKREHRLEYRDGALQCLSPVNLTEESSPTQASQEIARCLQEPKVNLVSDAIGVLGVSRVLQFFNETVEIQKAGGQPILNGASKRTPGGVFLTLIKNSADLSAAEKAEIFKKDKKVTAEHKKQARKRKAEVQREKSKAAQSQQQLAALPPDLNMKKRLIRPQHGDEEHVELAGEPEGVELTSVSERVGPFGEGEEAEPMQVEKSSAGIVKRGGAISSQQQAEMDLNEFEQTDVIELDVNFDDL